MPVKVSLKRIFVFILLIAAVTTALFYGGRYLLYIKIRNTIATELKSLEKQDVFVTYDHMQVHPWVGKIEFVQLMVKMRKDSAGFGIIADIPYVLLKGIDLIPFIKNKTLSLHIIEAHQPRITYVKQSQLIETDSTARRNIEFRNIQVKRVDFPGLDIYVKDTVGNDTVTHMLADVTMNDLFLVKQNDSLTWEKGDVMIADFAIRMFRENYGISVKNVSFEVTGQSIHLDSLRIKPVLTRAEYMKSYGRQTTYMEGVVPYLDIEGIRWHTYPWPSLSIDKVSIQGFFKMFRDKRYPFLPEKKRILPAHFLQRINVRMDIDTIRLVDSYVSYEEYPEEGDSTGIVYFDNIHATILSMHNNPVLERDTYMKVYSKFMGAGELNAEFSFPRDTTKAYSVKGTLKDLPMNRLNNMLGSAAKAKIESGIMTNLKFHFTYNELKSTGEVELNYENLKILSLRENRKNQQAVSKIKTLLLNTFIIKRDMNEDMEDDRRTGTIDFYRDTDRSLFNFWWKSIFSGIKSAYKLDKLPIDISGKNKKNRDKKDSGSFLSRIFKGDKKEEGKKESQE